MQVDIKDIVENQLGLTNHQKVIDYCNKVNYEVPTQEQVDILSPDKINLYDFWEYLEKNYDYAICGLGGKTPEERDRLNMVLALGVGVLNVLEAHVTLNSDIKLNVLEIGPGYGNICSVIMGRVNYAAIDVYPRFPGVCLCDGKTIPSELKATKFHVVISCNVFQHLSIDQRRSYYKEVFEILEDGGVFSFTNRVLPPEMTSPKYVCHAGQLTEVQKFEDINKDILDAGFTISSYSMRCDNFATFHLRKPHAKPA